MICKVTHSLTHPEEFKVFLNRAIGVGMHQLRSLLRTLITVFYWLRKRATQNPQEQKGVNMC